jgi:Major intrinsic protein
METGKSSWERSPKHFVTALLYETIGAAVITYAYTLTNKDSFLRSVAYFACYVVSVNVSGAHFNPATTLAVYLTEKEGEKRSKNFKYLICAWVAQLLGCYLGVLISFLLAKDYDIVTGAPSEAVLSLEADRNRYEKVYYYQTQEDPVNNKSINIGRVAF